MNIKNVLRGRCADYITKYPEAKYFEGKRPWAVYEG